MAISLLASWLGWLSGLLLAVGTSWLGWLSGLLLAVGTS